MLIKNWKLFQLTDSTHKAPHHLWRNHWRWWVWNASGKREYARNARVGKTWTHWIFAQTSCLLECAWFPSSFPLLSCLVLESSTQNAYYCWKGLWGSIWCVGGSLRWDWGRGLWASCALCVDDTSCILSGWPALAFTFCLPPVATNWQLMCTHDQLRGTLQLGLMDALLGWGLWWGADSLSKQTLEAGSLSQRWVTSLGRSALKLLLIPLQLLPGVVRGLVWSVYRPMSNCQRWNCKIICSTWVLSD